MHGPTGRAGVQECDRCSGRDKFRPRESGRQGGVTQAGLAKAKECFHLTIHPSEQDGKKSPVTGMASEHHVASGALQRARPVFRVAADALLVQGVGALRHVRVALLRIVALRAGCGLVVFVLGQRVVALPAGEAVARVRGVPGVADARVYGLPSAITGELVAAEIVAHEPLPAGTSPDSVRSAALALCRERLEPHAVPRVLDFVKKLTTTSAGKILRR